MNVTITLPDLSRVYLMTRAVMVGDVEIDTKSGEVSGIEFAADNLKQIDGRGEVECCHNAGGRVSIEVDGKRYKVRSDVTISPLGLKKEAGANSDGSLYVTTEAKPRTVKVKFSDHCGLRPEQLMSCGA